MKKAETQMNSTIEQIKSILNPVRVLKVKEDWMKVADVIRNNTYADYRRWSDEALRFHLTELLSRYESITSQPLVKEMFVCEVEKPKEITPFVNDNPNEGRRRVPVMWEKEHENKKEKAAYQAAQKKILFEGFEKRNMFSVEKRVDAGVLIIHEGNVGYSFSIEESWTTHQIRNCIIHDLIIEISRYNRTASNPIQINFSDNFIQELIK